MTGIHDRLQQALGAAYRLERELGGGGMSHVFLAEEVALGRRVVVKVLPPDLAASVSADRFRREIQLAAQLQHPGIVPLLSAGAQGDLLWYVMPFVEGESLRARIARGSMPVDEAVRLWRDLLGALDYAHGRGLVHRDIKPENIMLTGGRAVTLDFGVAKAVTASTSSGSGSASMTGIGLAIGTPAYMAPEQAAGDGAVDGRADLYAAGLVLYEMLAGRGPFEARTPAEMMAAHIAMPPVPIATRRPEIDAGLATLVMACLAKRPEDRPENAAAVVARLETATRSGAISAGAVSAPPRATGRRSLALTALAAVVVAAGGYAALRSRAIQANATIDASVLASLPDSSRLQIAFLPVVAEALDSLLARTLVSAQIRGLQGDRRILLQTPERIASIAADVDYPATASPDSLKTLYRDLGIHAYIVHTIARTGSGALLVAEGYATSNDSVLFRVEAAANSAAELSAATAKLTSGALAEALRGFGKVPRPLVSGRLLGTTPDAARLYVESREYFDRGDYLTVAKKLRLALQLDSNFAYGWQRLAGAINNANIGSGSSLPMEHFEALRRAYALRAHLPNRVERLYTEAQYLRRIGDYAAALSVITSAVAKFPDNRLLLNALAQIAGDNRDFELAARANSALAEKDFEARVGSVFVASYGASLVRLGRLTDAQALSRRVDQEFGRTTIASAALRTIVAQGVGDPAALAEAGQDRLRLATTESGRLEGYTLQRTAMVLSGRLDSASRLEQKRRAIAQEQGVAIQGVQSIASEGLRRALFVDDRVRAITLLDSGLAALKWTTLPVLDRAYPFVINARIAVGQLADARRLVDDWERGVPPELVRVQRPLIETARGEVALAEGKAIEAARHFRAGDVGACVSCVAPRLARAFDAMRNADSTLYWYERYLATPSLNADVDSRELAGAYRRLGELYEAKGDTKRALQRYSDFVALWKNADAVLQPAVKDVRERIARLQKQTG